MIKRVNFTGRRRITRDRIDIEVFDGSPRTFDAAIRLDGMSLLPGAAVYLEAMCAGSNVIERFPFGVVENIQPPKHRRLEQLEGENVFFTLKVVDTTQRFGRILGIAEHIRPARAGKQTAAGRRGILPIEPVDLNQELWRLEFRDHDVYLLVNRSIPGLVDRARSDALFFSIVYPEVVRRVLCAALDQDADVEEDDDRWPVLWRRFGMNLHPSKETPPAADDPDEDKEEWVESVVQEFCEAHQLKEKYVEAIARSEGGAT
jgi:hypothetical protein